MLLLSAIALAGLPILTRAAANVVAIEDHIGLPAGWRLNGPANNSDTLMVFVALKQPKLQELKTQLAQSNTLKRRDAAGHASVQDIQGYREPDSDAMPSVLKWLDAHGVQERKTYDSWISFNLTAQAARDMLEANLNWFSYANHAPVLRTQHYSIPAWLIDYIDFIYPLLHFLPPRTRQPHLPSKPSSPPKPTPESQPEPTGSLDLPCSIATYPDCIRRLYNITVPLNSTQPSPSRLGLAGFLEQYVSRSDVHTFLDTYAPELLNLTPPYDFSVSLLNSGANPDSLDAAGSEASLDVEYAMALAYPANITYYSTGGRGVKLDPAGNEIPPTGSDNEPYLEFLQAMLALGEEEMPHVLSISYSDDEQSVPRAYAERVCDLFAQLAARGVSVVVASGDGGAAGIGQSVCLSNDVEQRKRLLATFPASCPWVTAVGATENEGPPVMGAGFSSGGFSEYFARPSWQDGVVGPYVERVNENGSEVAGLFNVGGRAIPDISAIGAGFDIVRGGYASAVMGTSASTPIVAAMVALVNDRRLRQGKPSVGWLNPLLYGDEFQKVLQDITVGESYGCSFGDGTAIKGWEAGPGYDAVTGLGVIADCGLLLDILG